MSALAYEQNPDLRYAIASGHRYDPLLPATTYNAYPFDCVNDFAMESEPQVAGSFQNL